MASRLAFQTQLASIMEVLANAAVAEICKLVDDDYAVVSLQMSQCQRENKVLKRKLNLMELKMARGFAERRLRDSAASIGRTRVHVGSNDRFRSSSAASGVVFEGQMDMVPWPGGVVPGAASRETTTCDLQQDMSADVELVEAELVKQEKMEETEEDVEEEVQLIRADGQMERGPGGGRVQRSSRPQQEVQAAYRHNECPDPAPSASTRGVEVSGSSPLLKAQLSAHGPRAPLHPPTPLDPLLASSQVTNGDALAGQFCDEVPEDPTTTAVSRPSCSYSAASAFPSTCGGNGWSGGPSAEGSDPVPPRPSGPAEKALRPERLFVCTFCWKAFNRPKKLEIHQRIHTGEKPFSCPTCGKMFSEAGNLKKHQRVHSGDTYSCYLCGKGFAWIRNLKAHQRKSHPEILVDQES